MVSQEDMLTHQRERFTIPSMILKNDINDLNQNQNFVFKNLYNINVKHDLILSY